MSNNGSNGEPDSDQLDLYLDRMLDPQSEKEFLEAAQAHEQISEQKSLQDEIDASLRNSFGMNSTQSQSLQRSIKSMLAPNGNVATGDASAHAGPESDLGKNNQNSSAPNQHGQDNDVRPASGLQPDSQPGFVRKLLQSTAFKVALTAGLLLAIGINFSMNSGNSDDPVIEPRSLAMLYQEKVSQGFLPYYNCEDMNRFADTFEARQGIRLTLREMPEGTQMTGLSYLGGMSGDTTAMLGLVDDKQVIVFVDRADHRDTLSSVTSKLEQHPELNLFVVEKYDLIFVEVSPLPSSRLIEHMIRE